MFISAIKLKILACLSTEIDMLLELAPSGHSKNCMRAGDSLVNPI